jgi:hypothetical protein
MSNIIFELVELTLPKCSERLQMTSNIPHIIPYSDMLHSTFSAQNIFSSNDSQQNNYDGDHKENMNQPAHGIRSEQPQEP